MIQVQQKYCEWGILAFVWKQLELSIHYLSSLFHDSEIVPFLLVNHWDLRLAVCPFVSVFASLQLICAQQQKRGTEQRRKEIERVSVVV